MKIVTNQSLSQTMNTPDHPWQIAYHSGMTSFSDFRAIAQLGMPVGVVATLLTLAQQHLAIPRHLDQGGMAFVDSGAFTAFQKKQEMDWSKVIRAYETIATNTIQPANLSVVAPDVIGDQVETRRLWVLYADSIRKWVGMGVRVIIPLQVGEMSGGELFEEACAILGTRKLACGIPSNAAAMSHADCGTIRNSDFHILGRVRMTDELRLKVSAILASNPGANLTSDANWLRARTAKICRIRAHLPAFSGDFESRRMRAVQALLATEGYPQTRPALPLNQATC
jgi:hypothetical protein